MTRWFQLKNFSSKEKAAADLSKWMAIIAWDEDSKPFKYRMHCSEEPIKNRAGNGPQCAWEDCSDYRICDLLCDIDIILSELG
jgi:hypothetical protein